jgi:hypothetical protein
MAGKKEAADKDIESSEESSYEEESEEEEETSRQSDDAKFQKTEEGCSGGFFS